MVAMAHTDLLWTIGRVVALGCALMLLLTYVLGRLRLTDWLGYGFAAVFALLSGMKLVETSVWAAGVGIPVALAAAFLWARAMVRVYRENPELEFSGFFTVGDPPERVRGWPRKGPGDPHGGTGSSNPSGA